MSASLQKPDPLSDSRELGLSPLLARVRRRLSLLELIRGTLLGATASLGSGMLLLALATVIGPTVLWLPLVTAWGMTSVSGLLLLLWRWRMRHVRLSDEELARYVGKRVPDLRSDLLSTVQLSKEATQGTTSGLLAELCRRTAAATATLSSRHLVDFRPARQAALLAVTVSVGVLMWVHLVALPLRTGLGFLLRMPPENPIQVSVEPLVGDLRART